MTRAQRKLVIVLVVVGFVGLLLYNTLSAQKVTCEVCVTYNGKRNCATASHATEGEAVQSAQTTACGPLTSGMNDAIACGRIVPEERSCRTQ
ncbi:MAG TPA: hypothetical protein VJN95_04390 [Gemmatimonadales bacterium]|nr:hypothetical protein [Gemmatimonadales bacterium]